MNYETDELSSNERQAFAALPTEMAPPAFLEDRVVNQLKHSGVIRTMRKNWLPGYGQLAAGFAIALVLFVVGVFVGSKWNTKAAPPEEAGFILIVRNESAESGPKTPQEELERVKEYGSWARDLGGKGMLLGGEKLKDESRVLGPKEEAYTKPVEGGMGGYFLLPATSYDQALAIARTCPHLKHGGSVELRQIDRF
ncbi:MAG TPA: hypothetical protein VN643_16945 [Pyrinomonadaceae bacterium]|nr:hypothetical protein [Pyrinomonadaceae bacterium]